MCARSPACWIVITAILLCGGDVFAGDSASAGMTGSLTTYTVAPGDSLAMIAARFGVYPTTIAADNGIDRRRPLTPGQVLQIDNRHIVPGAVIPGRIVVNIPQRMVFFDDSGQVVGYPIAVGRTTWHTPTGSFTVVRKDENPAWHPPESIRAESARAGHSLPRVVPPGPRNPLGHFWIGLSLSGIGIHGTTSQSSIYQTTTHGCIRLQQDPIEDLYGRVSVGTQGQVIYEPVLVAAVGHDVFIEVHPDAYRRLPVTLREEARRVAARLGLDGGIDWALADHAIDQQAGIARRVSRNW